MGNYVILNHYNKNGKLGISKDTFKTIGIESMKNIDGIKFKTKKEKDSVIVSFTRDNQVSYKFLLIIDENVDEKSVKEQISSNLTANLLSLCDAIPFDINFSIEKNKDANGKSSK